MFKFIKNLLKVSIKINVSEIFIYKVLEINIHLKFGHTEKRVARQ